MKRANYSNLGATLLFCGGVIIERAPVKFNENAKRPNDCNHVSYGSDKLHTGVLISTPGIQVLASFLATIPDNLKLSHAVHH